MNLGNFFAELKRRNVYKVAVAYAVVGWLIIQIATSTFPVLEIPNVATKLVIAVVLLGFPIALVIAWAFEMTPEGMKRTANVSPDEKIPQWSRRKFAAFILLVVICAAALLGYQVFRGRVAGGAPATTNGDVLAGARPSISPKSIAVLPLLNESGDPKDDYFSDGLSEELIAALAQIRELKVIGRSSSFRFKERKEESKTIGEKLGVATLLEGTVRKQGGQCGSSPN
jgi:Predicted integral membrane protein